MALCQKAGGTHAVDKNGRGIGCSAAPVAIGFPIDMAAGYFCGSNADSLCSVVLSIRVESAARNFAEIVERFSSKYGPPNVFESHQSDFSNACFYGPKAFTMNGWHFSEAQRPPHVMGQILITASCDGPLGEDRALLVQYMNADGIELDRDRRQKRDSNF